jgi:kynurenine formamidase
MKRRLFLQWTSSVITSFGLNAGCRVGSKLGNDNNSQKRNIAFKGIKRSAPSEQEYIEYSRRFRNWGRWGTDDRFGTLNFINSDTIKTAQGLIKQGLSISLSRPIINAELSMQITRNSISWGEGKVGVAQDKIGIVAHGYTQTHIDALSHVFSIDGKLYNGYPESDITEKGAKSHGIENWSNGIITRGVLYDIPQLRGVDSVALDRPVQGWELEDFARQNNIEPRIGDAVIINCGRNAYFNKNPGAPNTIGLKPGLYPSVLEFLYAYDCALMGSDFDEAPNNEYSTKYPIHTITNPYMGLPTLWNLDLDKLATSCSKYKTWEFAILIAPLVVVGGTGSVVNPIAVL